MNLNKLTFYLILKIKTMKKQFLFFLVGLVIMSCSKELSTNTKNQIDRLAFKNVEEYSETYNTLSKMSSTEELLYWAQSKNHSTLLNSSVTEVELYSDALKTLLNKDSEFELGSSIIWFHEGKLYSFSKNDEDKISSLKKTPDKLNCIGTIRVSAVGQNDGLKSINLNLNALDGRNQKTFFQQYYQPCGGTLQAVNGDRKYVHEIYDESTAISTPPYGAIYTSYLHLRIKLEYKGSKYWKPAGEQRTITLNVTGTAQWVPTTILQQISLTGSNYSYTCSGNKDFVIASVQGYGAVTNPYWIVSLSGSIYQKVNGDITSNGWTNSGILW